MNKDLLVDLHTKRNNFFSFTNSRDNHKLHAAYLTINAKVTRVSSRPIISKPLTRGSFHEYICCHTVHKKYLLILKLRIPTTTSHHLTSIQTSNPTNPFFNTFCSSLVESLVLEWSFTMSKRSNSSKWDNMQSCIFLHHYYIFLIKLWYRITLPGCLLNTLG